MGFTHKEAMLKIFACLLWKSLMLSVLRDTPNPVYVLLLHTLWPVCKCGTCIYVIIVAHISYRFKRINELNWNETMTNILISKYNVTKQS